MEAFVNNMVVQGTGCLSHSILEGQQHHRPYCTRGKFSCYGERFRLDRSTKKAAKILPVHTLPRRMSPSNLTHRFAFCSSLHIIELCTMLIEQLMLSRA